jgi:hypothetical protein
MMEMSFEKYWELIKTDLEATGYPLPDEDIVDLEHMAGVLPEDFLTAFKAAMDAERAAE